MIKSIFLLGMGKIILLSAWADALDNVPVNQYESGLHIYAEAGSKERQIDLFLGYYWGQRMPQSFHKAFEWLSRLAQDPNPSPFVLNAMGHMLHKGLGCQKDDAQAVAYFTKAVEHPHARTVPIAFFNLSAMWIMGKGVKEGDKERAFLLFNRGLTLAPGVSFLLEGFQKANSREFSQWLVQTDFKTFMQNASEEKTRSLFQIFSLLVQWEDKTGEEVLQSLGDYMLELPNLPTSEWVKIISKWNTLQPLLFDGSSKK